MYATFAEVIAV